jgi:catechol 2,3-dioxygenase-like lactoylglutathione lyase family enzyme
MDCKLNHVAVLVADIARASAVLSNLGYTLGPAQEFPAEGTREIYVGEPQRAARLLLLQPIGHGPYAAALAARGAGLHHVAIVTASVEAFLRQVAGAGWYLHPRSLETFREARTVWLARPGVPTLVEVFEAGASSKQTDDSPVVSRVEVPTMHDKPRLLEVLGVAGVAASTDGRVWLTLDAHRIDPAALDSTAE